MPNSPKSRLVPAKYWRDKKREQRKANPERERETWKRYYDRNRERLREKRTAYMREYRRLAKLKQQNGGDLNE